MILSNEPMANGYDFSIERILNPRDAEELLIFAIYTCFTKGSDTKYLHITQRSIDQIETNLAESYRGP